MADLRRIVPPITLTFTAALTVLCVVGAFLGAERAWEMFNSAPLAVFWVLLAALLAAGILACRNLLTKPGLLAAHLGALVILLGAMTGSEAGHRLAGKVFGETRVRSGFMAVPQGEEANWLMDSRLDERLGQLPFSIHLNRFWIEHYPPGAKDWVLVWSALIPANDQTGQGPSKEHEAMDWTLGEGMDVPHTKAQAKVLEFTSAGELLRMTLELSFEDRRQRVELAPKADEISASVSVSETLKLTAQDQDADDVRLFLLKPQGDVKDYKSDLSVIRDGKEVARKIIEVNDPLHYGGYHFYQNSYDLGADHACSILLASSDTGLYAVYGGFGLMIAGLIHVFYIQPVVRAIRWRKHDHPL